MKNAKTAAAARRGKKTAGKSPDREVTPAELRQLGALLIHAAGALEGLAGILNRVGGAK